VADNFSRPKFGLQARSNFFFGAKFGPTEKLDFFARAKSGHKEKEGFFFRAKFDDGYFGHFGHRVKRGPIWISRPLISGNFSG